MKISIPIRPVAPALLALSTSDLQFSTTLAQGTMFTCQGRVTINGTNLTGTGQLKFAPVTSTNANQRARYHFDG